LWENKTFDQIYITHTSVYEKLVQFHHSDPEKTRYIKIWGNHDLEWRKGTSDLDGLFPGICLYEAALLNNRILMWHGHQADPSCLGFRATVAKFFVGGIWTGMQRLGMKDPTRAASNPGRANKVDRRLHEWASQKYEGIQVIIAGHTHRPVFSNLSLTEKWLLHLGIGTPGIERKSPDPSYYNTGSCVHPRCITGIEITAGEDQQADIKLIKWAYSAQSGPESPSSHIRDDFNLVVNRSVLEPGAGGRMSEV
jgi:predicted phosphodiesterase